MTPQRSWSPPGRTAEGRWVWRVLDAESEPGQVLAAWKDVLRSDDQAISVLESLVFETNMGRFAARASTRMPGGMRYAKTLHVVRQRVALSLWEHALSVNWRRPVVFCRSLRLARTYLTAVVANHALTDEKSRFQFSGRLGQAAVLLARFEPVGTADLEASAEQFRMSVAEGTPPRTPCPTSSSVTCGCTTTRATGSIWAGRPSPTVSSPTPLGGPPGT
ncbi:hypothetical protein ACFQVA_36390 [Actinomadura keratinilytica]